MALFIMCGQLWAERLGLVVFCIPGCLNVQAHGSLCLLSRI